MTPAALFVSLILSFAPAPAAAPQSCSLPGLWLGQDRNRESVGMWLEFAQDGSVLRANGRIVNGTWTLEGDTLTLIGPQSLRQRATVKLDGTEMKRKAEAAILEVAVQESSLPKNKIPRIEEVSRPDTSEARELPPQAIQWLDEHSLTRLTAPVEGQAAIIGAWSYKNRTGRTTLERYSARRYVVLDPLVAQRGTFAVEGGKLSVTADGQTMNVPITCGRNSFELEVGGRKLRFMKFE